MYRIDILATLLEPCEYPFFRLIEQIVWVQCAGILGASGFLSLRRLLHDSSYLCASGRHTLA